MNILNLKPQKSINESNKKESSNSRKSLKIKRSLKKKKTKSSKSSKSKNKTNIEISSPKIKKKLKNIEPIIVNEPSFKKPILSNQIKIIKKPIPTINIIYIYRKEKYETTVKQNLTIQQFKEILCKKLHLFPENNEIYFKNFLIPEKNLNDNIMIYIRNYTGICYFQIKKKLNLINSDKIIQKSYNYKVKVSGINNLKNFYNNIKLFFKDTFSEPDFICEPISKGVYNVGFSFADLAFDFHRYLFILKMTSDIYKDIVTSIQLNKNSSEKNIHYFKTDNKNKHSRLANSLSSELIGPYKQYDNYEKDPNNLYISF